MKCKRISTRIYKIFRININNISTSIVTINVFNGKNDSKYLINYLLFFVSQEWSRMLYRFCLKHDPLNNFTILHD